MNNSTERVFTNSQGFLVNEADMAPQDILKHDLVVEHVQKAAELSKQHEEFKRKVFSDIQDFIGLLASEYKVDLNTGRGNLTLNSYDMKSRIIIGIGDQIEFGVEIDLAKKLINEVVTNELSGSSTFLKQIVLDAFQADTQGKYNKVRILALRKHRNAHESEKWANAMRALDDGIIAGTSKTYIRFYTRNAFGKWEQIPMVNTSI